MRKPPSPTKITKSATDPSAAREKIDSTVADMDLSSIKFKKNSKSKIKEHTLSSNNLDKALHDTHLLNTMQNLTNKDKQTKKFFNAK